MPEQWLHVSSVKQGRSWDFCTASCSGEGSFVRSVANGVESDELLTNFVLMSCSSPTLTGVNSIVRKRQCSKQLRYICDDRSTRCMKSAERRRFPRLGGS